MTKAIFPERVSISNNDDLPQENCGVIGVYAPGEDVARLTFFGLFALQHRGQESAGISVTDGETIKVVTNMGLVAQAFREEDLKGLNGHISIGHTRYSTSGSSLLCNAQPMLINGPYDEFAIAHNGTTVTGTSTTFSTELVVGDVFQTSDENILLEEESGGNIELLLEDDERLTHEDIIISEVQNDVISFVSGVQIRDFKWYIASTATLAPAIVV